MKNASIKKERKILPAIIQICLGAGTKNKTTLILYVSV